MESSDRSTQVHEDIECQVIPFLWEMEGRDPAVEPWILEVAIEEKPGEGLNKSIFLEEPTAAEMRDVLAWANEEGYSLYFGVLPRQAMTPQTGEMTPFGPMRRRAGGDCVVSGVAPFTWLDLDPPGAAKGNEQAHRIWREQRLKDLLELEHPPSLVVSSGNGLHAYWKLLNDDGYGWMANYCVMLASGLAKKLGGDPAVAQRAALLRLPGSYHRKSDPRLVKVLHCGESVGAAAMMPYRLVGMRSIGAKQRGSVRLPVRKTGFCGRCAKHFQAWPPEDGAHTVLYKLVLACVSHGWKEDEIIKHALDSIELDPKRPNRRPEKIRSGIMRLYRSIEEGGVRPFTCRNVKSVVKGEVFYDEPNRSGRIIDLVSGREALREAVSRFRESESSLFISAPTGLGKTRLLIRQLTKARKTAKKIVYCAPTKEGVREARGDFPGWAPISLLFGRSEREGGFHCAKKGRMDRLAEKRRNLANACRACELRHECPWVTNFRRFVRSPIGMATQDAVASNPMILDDAVLIIDEKITGMLTRSFRISSNDLRRYAFEVDEQGKSGKMLSGLARRLALAIECAEDLDGKLLSEELFDVLDELSFGAGLGCYAPFSWEEELPDDAEACAPALTEILLQLAGLLVRNPENSPIFFDKEAVTISLPNEPVLRAIKEGRVLAADATAPIELVRKLGFDIEELRFDETKDLEVIGVAGKTYGSGSQEEVVRIARNFLSLGGAVVCRKAEADVLRREIPERAEFILHYGAHRGSNVVYKAQVNSILVTRWMKNPRALRHEARQWAIILGSRVEVPEIDLTGEGLAFPGTEWAREGAGLPTHEILRAVVVQDRREVLQAIGRLRAQQARADAFAELKEDDEDYEPVEWEVGRLTAYILDGFPVPDVIYEEVLGDEEGAGGEIELYDHLIERLTYGGPEIDLLITEVERLRGEREARRDSQMVGAKAANAARAEESRHRARRNAAKLRSYKLRHPGATNRQAQADLGLSEWELRKALALDLDGNNGLKGSIWE